MMMKPENEMNEEVRQLLDSLEEHGKNVRRQQALSDLMDGLSEERKVKSGTAKPSTKWNELKRKTFNYQLSTINLFWWAIGAAAAVLLLWLMVRPSMKQAPDVHEEILVEETRVMDAIKTDVKDEVEEVIIEEPIVVPVIASSAQPSVAIHSDSDGLPRRIAPRNDVAEVIPVESQETMNTVTVESNNTSASMEENLSPLTSHLSPQSSPQRRVVRSLNLVCYECQKEPEIETSQLTSLRASPFSTLNSQFSTTLFGQAQDPNMRNGAMTFELKLN